MHNYFKTKTNVSNLVGLACLDGLLDLVDLAIQLVPSSPVVPVGQGVLAIQEVLSFDSTSTRRKTDPIRLMVF